jgi:hypothetical protein
VPAPRLLVIDRYRMGVALRPTTGGTHLRVLIDYDLPARLWGRWLGRLFGRAYARWCVRQMLGGVSAHFALHERRAHAA